MNIENQNKYLFEMRKIDRKILLKIFPLLFILFNFIYWPICVFGGKGGNTESQI